MAAGYRMVRAKRNGSWDGHRRRAGVVFPVKEGVKESWFEDVGPAPEDVELPPESPAISSPTPKGFIDIMKEQANTERAPDPQPSTLAEAAGSVAGDLV